MPSFKVEKQNEELYKVIGDLTFFTIHKKSLHSFNFLKPHSTMTIDLEHVHTADSAGLALLIELLKKSKKNRGQLYFTNTPKQLLTLASLSGLDIENIH